MDPIKLLTNCRIFSNVSQEEDEAAWLAARSRGIGGSDVGAICGVSPFTSARQIYLKKTGQFPSDADAKLNASSERMHWGHMLEPVIADEYARRTGAKIIEVNATLVHKDYPWALANIDRLIVEEEVAADGTVTLIPAGVLECKSTSEYMNDEWESGEILMSYIYQINWYLWILGLTKGAFACLVGGNKFYEYTVFRNDDLLNNEIIPAVKKFWEVNVKNLIEPEMQSTDTEFANTIYGDVKKNSEVVWDDDVTNGLAKTVFDCKAQIKELTAIMEAAQNNLKDKLKDTEIGYTHDYTVKWSPRNQNRIDSERLKSEYPDVYQDCLKQISFRAMSVKGGK